MFKLGNKVALNFKLPNDNKLWIVSCFFCLLTSFMSFRNITLQFMEIKIMITLTKKDWRPKARIRMKFCNQRTVLKLACAEYHSKN